MAKKQSLLELAMSKQLPKKRNRAYTDEQVELALAWANDEITITQVAHAIDTTVGTATYTFLALCLKYIISTTKK